MSMEKLNVSGLVSTMDINMPEQRTQQNAGAVTALGTMALTLTPMDATCHARAMQQKCAEGPGTVLSTTFQRNLG